MTAPNFEAVALAWLVQHLGYPRKGLESELARLLQKVRDDATKCPHGGFEGGCRECYDLANSGGPRLP